MKKRTRILGLRVPMLAFAAVAGLITLMAFLQPTPAYADLPKFYLDCPTTEVREGESFEVFLVWDHSDSGWRYGAWWHTDAGTADSSDFTPLPGESSPIGWSNTAETTAKRQARAVYTTEDTNAEGDETFTVRFTPVDNVADRNNPDRDEKCEITIVDDDPNITGIDIISTPARDSTYGIGETIEVEATFSTSVDVDGNPGLGLWVGSNWQSASYLRGSGTNRLVFGYSVRSADRDSDGIRMDGGYQDGNGRWHNLINHTAITATGTETVAYRVYAGIGDQSAHKVDGSLALVGTSTEITSSPDSGDTYRYGETIEFSITFSAPLEVEGSRHLSLRVGSDDSDAWRGATYQTGSGTNTLVFGYTVQTGDLDDSGITMLGTWVDEGEVHGLGGSGTVRVKGTDVAVTPTFTGLSNQSGHKVNGQPYPKIISITSTPGYKSDTYWRDEIIQVSVNFGQNVTAGDNAIAILGMASVPALRNAAYASGNGTDTLVFEYTVLEKDRDNNGINAFVPRGQDIKATGTEIAYQPNPGGVIPRTGDDPNHKVDGSLVGPDTTSPTISSIAFADSPGPGDDSTYGAGDWIGVHVTFNESMQVTGEPEIQLNIGGAARQAQYGHFPVRGIIDRKVQGVTNLTVDFGYTVTFGYTVQEGDVDSDGISIGSSKITLNGGAVQDEADNNAVLTHDAVADDSGHRVDADTTAPTVSSVAVTSDPGDDDTYGKGDAIEVTVTFSEDVTVTGTPQMELDFDGTAKTADYSNTNGAAVVFSYTVALNDSATNGMAIGANKLSVNGSAIKDGSDNDATLTHDAVDPDSGHKVDGSDTTAPTVSSVAVTSDPGDDDTYGIGDSIDVTVTFSEDVTVTGTPQMELDFDGTAKTADYRNTNGAAVVFSYTVALNDSDADGIAINANKLSLNGGTVQDEAANNATLTHAAAAADSGHKVDASDTTAPTTSSMSITSDPGSDYTYRTGDVIQVTVTFSEDVVVTGAPQLELNMYESDPAARLANYSSVSGANVVFTYTVAVGDSASDGLDIEANKLTLNGGAIQDAAGNDAVLTHSALSADPGHFVNGAGGV